MLRYVNVWGFLYFRRFGRWGELCLLFLFSTNNVVFECSFGVGVSCFFVFNGKDNLLFLADKKNAGG